MSEDSRKKKGKIKTNLHQRTDSLRSMSSAPSPNLDKRKIRATKVTRDAHRISQANLESENGCDDIDLDGNICFLSFIFHHYF